MSEKTQSKIVLDEHSVNTLIKWLLMQDQENPVKNVKVTHEEDHLHLKFNMNYAHMPGWINIPIIGRVHPIQQMVGDHIEGDLHLSVKGKHLKGKLDLHGIGLTILQNIPGIDNIIFFFAPYLRNVGAFRIHGPSDFDFDLSSINIPDGNGGDGELTDIVNFHSISVGDRHGEMLITEFSMK
jgi:hypothetical protein